MDKHPLNPVSLRVVLAVLASTLALLFLSVRSVASMPELMQSDSSVAGESALTPYVVGTAVDLESGNFLYTEAHACSDDELSCVVEYHDAEAQLIARKTVDFRASMNAPNVIMKDLRLNTELSASPEPKRDLVVDAGFDHYVRSQWDALSAGKQVKFSFQVLGIDSVLTMKASQLNIPACSTTELCLLVEVNSWLLGLLADPIELTYDRQSQRLLEFRGLSNVKSPSGKSQQVLISYEYAAPEQG